MERLPHPVGQAASPWVLRFLPLLGRQQPVLDLACGGGRHLRAVLESGRAAVGVDIDLRGVADLGRRPGLDLVRADLEGGSWPFPGQLFAGIIVSNYLHRPLFPSLLAALAPGGLLLYETFAQGNGRFGRPSSPSFLLRSGELLDLVRGRLQVIAYEHGVVSSPKTAVVQRLAAINDVAPVVDLAGDPEPPPLPAPISAVPAVR